MSSSTKVAGDYHHEAFAPVENEQAVDESTPLTPVDFSNVPKEEIRRENIPGSTMSEADCVTWCQTNAITITGTEVPKPILEFEGLRSLVPNTMFEMFKDQRLVSPTPIQSVMWPAVLGGKDFIGIARTGSGKTLGFLIPAVMHILWQVPVQHTDGPVVVIMTPTRELAIQIRAEAMKVTGRFRNLNTACLYGGSNMREQEGELRALPSLLVATPGRLIDMLERSQLNLLRTSMMVVDEGDRMLDSGFSVQLNMICSQVRPDRQFVMMSATWPKEVEEIAARYTYCPITVRVGSEHLLANSNVRQNICAVESDEHRRTVFRDLIEKFQAQRVLIFVDRKGTADALAQELIDSGISAASLHGDKEQYHREKVIKMFQENNMCLVATDIASRGLDIKELDVVVNFNFPKNLDDYVHRIGRTGRAQRVGNSYTFVSKSDSSKVVAKLINVMKRAKQKPSDALFTILDRTPENFEWDVDLMPNSEEAAPVVPGDGPYGGYKTALEQHRARHAPRPVAPPAAPPAAPPRREVAAPPPTPAPVVAQKRQRESTFSAYGDDSGGSERW